MKVRLFSSSSSPSPHLVLTVLWFTYFWNQTSQQVVLAVMPSIQRSLSLSTASVGLLISSYYCGYAGGFYASSFVCTKLGRTRTIALSAVINALSMLSMSFSNGPSLLMSEAFVGLAVGLYAPAALSILSDLFAYKSRGRYIGLHEVAVPTGMTLGPIFASLMLGLGLNWNRIFLLWVVPVVIILLVQLQFLRIKDHNDDRQKGQQPPSTDKEVGTSAVTDASRYRASFSLSVPIGYLLLLLVVALFLRNVSFSEVFLLPVYWVSVLGATVAGSAFIYGITRVFSIFGQLAAGYLSDTFGRMRVLLVIQVSAAVLLVPSSYLGFGPSLFISFAGFSILLNCYMPVMFTFISDLSQSEDRAKNVGRLMSIGAISNIVSPTILGVLAQHYSFGVAWIYPIVTCFASFIVLLLVRNRLDKAHAKV